MCNPEMKQTKKPLLVTQQHICTCKGGHKTVHLWDSDFAVQKMSDKSKEIPGLNSRNEDTAMCHSKTPVLPVVTSTYLGGLQCSIGWGWSHLAYWLLSHYALALLEGNIGTVFSTSPKARTLLPSPQQSHHTRQGASLLKLQGCFVAPRC